MDMCMHTRFEDLNLTDYVPFVNPMESYLWLVWLFSRCEPISNDTRLIYM